MQNQKTSITETLTVLFWSLLIGVLGISIGLGALYPPLNLIARPFVCPGGQLTYQQSLTQATPNQTFFSAAWTCTQADATSQPVNPSLFAGKLYGLFCFPVGLFLKRRIDAKEAAERKAGEFRPYNRGNKSKLP